MISVITITFNNYDELTNTVNSVRGLPIEHIIINGGNCQKTAQFLATFDGVKLSEPDFGISDAFNKGVLLSTGSGIIFLNSGDILIDHDYFSWADEALKTYDFTYSDILFDDPIAGKIKFKPHQKPIGRGMPYPHQTMIVRREVFNEIGLFKLKYKRAMDFDFTCRLIKAKKNGTYLPKTTMLMEGTGISTSQEYYTITESKQALIENNLYCLENKLYFFIRSCGFKARMLLLRFNLKLALKFLKKIKNT